MTTPPTHDSEVYPVPAEWAARTHMDRAGYEAARVAAHDTPDAFWAEAAKRLDWVKAPTKIKDVSFHKDDFHIHWFADGVLNVAYNCVDRHLAERADQPESDLGRHLALIVGVEFAVLQQSVRERRARTGLDNGHKSRVVILVEEHEAGIARQAVVQINPDAARQLQPVPARQQHHGERPGDGPGDCRPTRPAEAPGAEAEGSGGGCDQAP